MYSFFIVDVIGCIPSPHNPENNHSFMTQRVITRRLQQCVVPFSLSMNAVSTKQRSEKSGHRGIEQKGETKIKINKLGQTNDVIFFYFFFEQIQTLCHYRPLENR